MANYYIIHILTFVLKFTIGEKDSGGGSVTM